eukprot:scaffold7784_cov239-Pinguiococcus_pyrenoidosus.AAC.2
MRARAGFVALVCSMLLLMLSWTTIAEAQGAKDPDAVNLVQQALKEEMKAQGVADAEDLSAEKVVQRIEKMKREANKAAKKAEAAKRRKQQQRQVDKGYFRNGEFVKHLAMVSAVMMVGLFLYAFRDDFDDAPKRAKKQE